MTVRLLTTEEVAARFRTSPATVRYWRHIGIGPPGLRSDVGCSTTRRSATGGGRPRLRRRGASPAEPIEPAPDHHCLPKALSAGLP
jgi:hypothetical protein